MSQRSRFMSVRPCIIAAFMAVGLFINHAQAVNIEQEDDTITLRHQGQIVRITNTDGRPHLSLLVESNQGDLVVFDSKTPIVRGDNFDLSPQWIRIVRNKPEYGELLLGGKHPKHGYQWTLAIKADTSIMPICFELNCDMPQQLLLQGLEPSILFETTNLPQQVTRVDQGPGNIYHGSAQAQWGNSFPAAYLYMDGVESAFFVDGGSMRWASPSNIFRFHNYRVQTVQHEHDLQFGLNVVKRNFHELPAGRMNIVFFLAARSADQPDNRLEALDRLISMVGPLHPGETPPYEHRTDKTPATWTEIAAGVAHDLTRRDLCWTTYQLPADRPWRDGPAFTDRTIPSFPISPDYAVNSSCIEHLNRTRADAAWDFSTCNNYLSGWMGWLASHPDDQQNALVRDKLAILPAFFDPQSGMISHGISHARALGPRGMSWQNFMFHIEMARVHQMASSDTFDPAVGGRFLMSLPALIELAHNNNYNFPQWFDYKTRQALIQNDLPELGVIYEPWQAGSYAWIMCQAHRMTGDERYILEARTAIEQLLTNLTFSIKNERYQMRYDDPVDFPITEIFGNAWGMPACLYIAQVTGDKQFERRARDFRNSLLRMTYWYESDLDENAKDQALRNLGLFRNHSGASTGSPWESSEAALAITEYLRLSDEPDTLLLKVLNTYRQSAMSYFPVALAPPVTPCPRFADHKATFLPVEDFYMLEHGGNHGGMGRCIYMSGAAFWNQQLFESGGITNQPHTLQVNLNTLNPLALNQERTILVFNPATEVKSMTFKSIGLSNGTYRLRTEGLVKELNQTRSKVNLESGIKFDVPANQAVRIHIEPTNEDVSTVTADWRARGILALTYCKLQNSANALNGHAISPLAVRFQEALTRYHEDSGNPDTVTICQEIQTKLDQLSNSP